MAHQWRGVIAEYLDFLPFTPDEVKLTLGEGGTPLVHAPLLSDKVNSDVYIKVEGMNPTGSFKDRGMVTAMSKAVSSGAEVVVCASTGNTSASAAAYATRGGLKSVVLLPQGKIAAGKLAQAVVHGAQLVQVDGNFDDCLRIARQLNEQYPVELVNSVNPFRLQGQKTAAFEIVDALGDAPDLHLLPVGNAGNISAYWMGYKEYAAAGEATKTPSMWGFQAAGASPLVQGHPVDDPETVATAIRIGHPASWDLAVAAQNESNGFFAAVTDEEILSAQALLAAEVGIFVEPASAAGVAGLLKRAMDNQVPSGKKIVITVTGNGLKDIDTALSSHNLDPVVIAPELEAAVKEIGL